MNPFNTEPSADLRTFASVVRQAYVALKNEGFNEDQAVELTKAMILYGNRSSE